MSSRVAYPPSVHHNTVQVSPKEAQEHLAAFLAKTSTNAHLHPNAILSQAGVQFPAQSGAQGGLALHHLRRIEAGLRGENLVAESRDELRALFGDQKDITDVHTSLDTASQKHEGRSKKRTAHGAEFDTQDAEQYAQAQTEVLEEIGNDTLAGQGEQVSNAPRVMSKKDAVNKAARKAAKLERRKEEKRKKSAG